jgi:hypothetical protein
MHNPTEEAIQEAIRQAKAGNKAGAKQLLSQVVRQEPDNARAWYLLSQAVQSKEQAIYCLERVLKFQPDNAQAKERLARLQSEGVIKPQTETRRQSGELEKPQIERKKVSSGAIVALMLTVFFGLSAVCAGLFGNMLLPSPTPTALSQLATLGIPPNLPLQATNPDQTLPTNTFIPTSIVAIPTATLLPTETPIPTSTPLPTETPVPISLNGRGQTATNPILLPSVYSKVTFTHNGSGNFAVTVFYGNDQDLLVNEIGSYKGTLFLNTDKPVTFDIQADGEWTAYIEGIGETQSASFSGTGDNVSELFVPPSPGAWEISHDGKSNFAVLLHCMGGSDLIVNEIGVFSGSTIISFDDGPCLWEVIADGNWNIKPR